VFRGVALWGPGEYGLKSMFSGGRASGNDRRCNGKNSCCSFSFEHGGRGRAKISYSRGRCSSLNFGCRWFEQLEACFDCGTGYNTAC
jgi:hypothetical protein